MTAAKVNDDAQQSQGSLYLYLAVFVLLLAFFILLNAVSGFQQQKSRAIVDSLRNTFGDQTTASQPPVDRERQAALAQATAILRSLGTLFQSQIEVARIEASGDGREMVVTLPISALFDADGVIVRSDRGGLLHRVADALTPVAVGLTIRMEFMVGAGTSPYPNSDLAVRQAGALARAVTDQGAMPSAITVGLESRANGWARLLFTVRDTAVEGG